MEYARIKELLDKYFEGNTSTHEENELRNFFLTGNVPEEFEYARQMFDSFSVLHGESSGDRMKTDISGMIDNHVRKINEKRSARIIRWVSVAAASFLIIAAIYTNIHKPGLKDTYTDSRQAYARTEQVLMYISANINRETAKLGQLQYLNKGISDLNKIDNAINNIKKHNNEKTDF
jgi:hypothetical protein